MLYTGSIQLLFLLHHVRGLAKVGENPAGQILIFGNAIDITVDFRLYTLDLAPISCMVPEGKKAISITNQISVNSLS